MTTISLAAARAQLSKLVDEAVSTHQRVEITRHGSRAAVLLAAADFDALIETIDVLSDAELVADIEEGLAAQEADTVARTSRRRLVTLRDVRGAADPPRGGG